MNRNSQPEEEARRTLDMLDHIGRAEGNPWLYTRIRARLEQEKSFAAAGFPAWQWAMVLLAVVASSVFFLKNTRSVKQQDALVIALTKTYDLNNEGYSNFIVEPQNMYHGNSFEK